MQKIQVCSACLGEMDAMVTVLEVPNGQNMAREVLMVVATTNAPSRIGAGLRDQNGPLVRAAKTVRKSESDTWERTSRHNTGGKCQGACLRGLACLVNRQRGSRYLEVDDRAHLVVGERAEAHLLEVRAGVPRTQHDVQQHEGGADRDAAKDEGQPEQLLQCGDPTDHSTWAARRECYGHGCSGVHLDMHCQQRILTSKCHFSGTLDACVLS